MALVDNIILILDTLEGINISLIFIIQLKSISESKEDKEFFESLQNHLELPSYYKRLHLQLNGQDSENILILIFYNPETSITENYEELITNNILIPAINQLEDSSKTRFYFVQQLVNRGKINVYKEDWPAFTKAVTIMKSTFEATNNCRILFYKSVNDFQLSPNTTFESTMETLCLNHDNNNVIFSGVKISTLISPAVDNEKIIIDIKEIKNFNWAVEGYKQYIKTIPNEFNVSYGSAVYV